MASLCSVYRCEWGCRQEKYRVRWKRKAEPGHNKFKGLWISQDLCWKTVVLLVTMVRLHYKITWLCWKQLRGHENPREMEQRGGKGKRGGKREQERERGEERTHLVMV